MGDHYLGIENVTFFVVLVVIGLAALVVTIYVAMWWCHHHREGQGAEQEEQGQQQQHALRDEVLEMRRMGNVSATQMIPSHKYQKAMGLVEDDDGKCTVCLSPFREDEELRSLPECLHSYHAPCIDRWLSSSSSCPNCRANAMPRSLRISSRHLSDFTSMHIASGMLLQSRTT